MVALDYWWSDLKFNWKRFVSRKNSLFELIFCIVLFIFTTYLFKTYLVIYEVIPGVRLDDFLLKNIKSVDLSIYVFVILYTVVFYNYLFLFAYPRLLVCFFIFYSTALLIRFTLLSFIHLEAPDFLRYLSDPLLDSITYNGVKITKDLFFSGHMVTIFCCYFAMPNRRIKYIFLACSISLAILLIIQHVHYTIDLLGAYIAVFILYRIYFKKVFLNSKFTYQYSKEIIKI
jgi:PAP2 superfamily C-terminal